MPKQEAATPQISPEKLVQESINELCEKHGVETLKKHVLAYAEKLGKISSFNAQILELDADEQEQEYSACVTNIMQATQDYYTYIGQLPEDLRRFFLLVADAVSGEDITLEELGTFMDADILIGMSPLLSIQSIRPKKFIMQIDAITNHLTSLGEPTHLKVGNKGNQPVKTTVTLDMPEHMKIEGGTLSVYDKAIINGITSLLESGNTVFSIPMLYHAMTGKQNPTVDEQLSEEIGGKLEKMRRMMLAIDITAESRAHHLTDENGEPLTIEDMTIEGILLPLNKMSGMINGRKTELYQMIAQPPLYTYAKRKRQLASAPITLLNAPVNNNSTTIPLKTYLLQRIELMKNRNNSMVSRNILYESIYAELGATDANKTKKMRIRNYTATILNYFVEQEYFTGFVEYKAGRTIKGIAITL